MLNEALVDSWYGVRANAATSLGLLFAGSRDASVASSVAPLLNESFGSVQVAAALALGKVASPDSFGVLKQTLEKATIPTAVACITALRSLGGAEAEALVAKYRRHPDPRVRAAAGGT
jgi:HEAT repeat protein